MKKPGGSIPGLDDTSGLSRGDPDTVQERVEHERGERYFLIEHAADFSQGSTPDRDRRYDGVVGTHVYVNELQSPVDFAVRVGSEANPFIPLRVGMTISRPRFVGLTVRQLGPVPLPPDSILGSRQWGSPVGRVRLYVSTGQLVQDPQRYGRALRPGFWSCQQATPVGPIAPGADYLFRPQGTHAMPQNAVPVFMKGGGSFGIRNRGNESIYIQWGASATGDPATGWEIAPGEVQWFEAESELFSRGLSGPNAETGVLCFGAGYASAVPYTLIVTDRGYRADDPNYIIPAPALGLNP